MEHFRMHLKPMQKSLEPTQSSNGHQISQLELDLNIIASSPWDHNELRQYTLTWKTGLTLNIK